MSNTGWREVVLRGLVNHKKGFAFKSKDYKSFGIPIVKVRNFTENSIDIKDCDFIDINTKEDYKNYKLKCGDVVIATVGSWLTNPNSVVGKTVRIPKDMGEALLNQNAVILRAFNELDQTFLFYLLKQDNFKYYLVGTAQGSANQASITLNDIFNYKFNLPPLPTQKAIAKILGDLDAKIEINRKMNESLEAMAQALFQSWFVDFDPVLDNCLSANNNNIEALPEPLRKKGALRLEIEKKSTPEINALFPSDFVFNEVLGKWIPEGWGVKSFGEVSKCFDSKRIPLSKKQREEKKPGIYPYHGATSINDYINDYVYPLDCPFR